MTPAIADSEPFIGGSDFILAENPRDQNLLGERFATAQFRQNLRRRQNFYESFAGRVETVSFNPVRLVAVPVKGLTYADEGGRERSFPQFFTHADAQISLVCIPSGRTMDILIAPSFDWYIRPVFVPADWCAGQVKLVAEAFSRGVRVGVGTPFKVGPLYWLMLGPLGWIASVTIALGAISIVCAPFLLLPGVPVLPRLALAALWPCVTGYVLYVLLSWGAGSVAALPIVAMHFVVPAGLARWVGIREGRRFDWDTARIWLSVNVAIAALLIGVRLLLPLGNSSWFANYAFYPATWSTDNQLPLMMAKHLLTVGSGTPPYTAEPTD